MRNLILLTAAMGVLSIDAHAQLPSTESASHFLPICRSAVLSASAPGDLSLLPNAMQCMQFVNGVMHGLAAFSQYSHIDQPFCAKGPVTTGTIIQIWVKFMEENRKNLDSVPAGTVLLVSLAKARPCD